MDEKTLDELNLTVNTIFDIAENDPELLISSIEQLVFLDLKTEKISTAVAIAGGRRLLALQAVKGMGRVQFAFYAHSEIRNLSDDRRQRWIRLAKRIDPEISPNLLYIPQRTLLPLLARSKDENLEGFLERHGVNVNFKSNNDERGAVLAEEARRLLDILKHKTSDPERFNEHKAEKTSSVRITSWSNIPETIDDADECGFEFEGVKLITHMLDWIEKHKVLKRFKNSGFLTSAFWELSRELSDHIAAYNNRPTTKTQFRKILSNDALYADLNQ